jgi:threonyl-tRNA synthetase
MSERDHRVIGQAQDLFMFHPDAPGAVIWLDRGEELYHTLTETMRTILKSEGYKAVRTPLMWKQHLWETSGHWDHYKENMFHWKDDEDGEVSQVLKPMNCPVHMAIFGNERRTYRDLPIRMYDPSVLHRNELSGSLGGLTRMRQFSQDDGHIFCTPEQIESEVTNLLDMVNGIYGMFGLDYECTLSTRPNDSMGTDEAWSASESALRSALDEYQNGDFKEDEGGGAFYGPKIDVHVTDSLGRKWQTATIQLDFNLPERFELTYQDENDTKQTPVVIHRAIFGSYERFIAILIEHFNGDFPTWLAPEQIRILSVSQKSNEYAVGLLRSLQAFQSVRAAVDLTDERLGRKIVAARHYKIPWMLVVGERDRDNKTVSVRHREHGDIGAMTLEAFTRLYFDGGALKS